MSDRPDRAVLQFLTEQGQKLEKRLIVLEQLHESDLKTLTGKIEGIGSSVTQYASVIDQMKEQVTKLPADILGQVDKALKQGSQDIVNAAKVYVDQRMQGGPIIQTVTGGSGATVNPTPSGNQGWAKVGDMISQRVPSMIESAFNKWVGGESSTGGIAINPNLAGRVNRAIEKMATRNMEEFALGLEKKLGLGSESAGPTTGVSH